MAPVSRPRSRDLARGRIIHPRRPATFLVTLDEYLTVGKQWGAMPSEDEVPEDKASDWGWYDGRRVALDCSTPAWGNG
jgi:hypothetical protein